MNEDSALNAVNSGRSGEVKVGSQVLNVVPKKKDFGGNSSMGNKRGGFSRGNTHRGGSRGGKSHGAKTETTA